ncbi:MAG: hypothetical protein WCT77_02880 [Bacteroidota bacterium]
MTYAPMLTYLIVTNSGSVVYCVVPPAHRVRSTIRVHLPMLPDGLIE